MFGLFLGVFGFFFFIMFLSIVQYQPAKMSWYICYDSVLYCVYPNYIHHL